MGLRCQEIAERHPLLWEEEPKTISEYRKCIIDTFQYWINVHTKPDWWVANWVLRMSGGDDYCTAKQLYIDAGCGAFKREYWEFDWDTEIENIFVLDLLQEGTIKECILCGGVVIIGYNDDLECPQVYEDTEEDGPHELRDIDRSLYNTQHEIDQLIQSVTDWCDDIESYASEEQMLRAARKGFYHYFTAMRSLISEPYWNMRNRIKLLTNTEGVSPEDQLMHILTATDIRHVNGNVFDDYASEIGVFLEITNTVRNNGLEEIFGKEAILNFLEGKE